MSQKKLLVTMHRAPFGTIFYTEGLRAAVGLTAGTDEHEVAVLYQGDAAWYALKNVDRSDADRYLATLRKIGAKMYVEREALAARGIGADEIAADVEVLSRPHILELLRTSDLNVAF